MRDLRSRKLIVMKGLLFLLIAVTTVVLAFVEAPSLRMAFLLAILVWSACRFYFFLFYVLEKYVDPTLKYAGLWALIARIRRA